MNPAGAASRKAAGLRVVAGLYAEGSKVPEWELPAEPSLQVSATKTEPRVYLNTAQATACGVLNLFATGQLAKGQRPFYVKDDTVNDFVVLKTPAFCRKNPTDPHFGYELRFKLVTVTAVGEDEEMG